MNTTQLKTLMQACENVGLYKAMLIIQDNEDNRAELDRAVDNVNQIFKEVTA